MARQPPAARQRAVHDVLVVGHVRGRVGDAETVLKALHQVLHRLGVWVNGCKRKRGARERQIEGERERGRENQSESGSHSEGPLNFNSDRRRTMYNNPKYSL